MQDNQLLTQYARTGSVAAFSQLVARHLPLVYRTCRRELGSETLAEDTAQVVFLLLARKAKTLRAGPSLVGWLFQTAMFVAKDVRKQEARRLRREEAAMQEAVHQQTTPPLEGDSIEPLLNAALSALKPADREAVLLRFFEGLTLAETGARLGVSEDAARMRCARALEKLRRSLASHGAAVPAIALSGWLTAEAAHPVPAHAAATITQGALQALSTAPTANILLLSKGVSQTMKLVKIKYATLAAGLLLAGAAVPSLVHAFSSHKVHSPTLAVSATQPLRIDEVRVTGNKIVPASAILVAFDIHAGDQVNEKQIQHSLTHVYDLYWFNLVGPFQLEAKTDGGYLLTLPVRETPGLEKAKPEEFQEQAEIGTASQTAEEAL